MKGLSHITEVTFNYMFAIKIKKSTKQDYQYCYRLTKTNMLNYFTKYWGGWKSEVFRKNFDLKSTKIIFKNNRRVGYYVLKNKNDHFYLDNIQISPVLIGKGIGTYLMKQIEKEVSKSNIRKIKLQVFKDNPAKRLYEKFEYKIIQDNGSSVVMEKKL